MSDFDRPGVTLDEPVKRRPAGSRLGDLGDRLARTLGGLDRTKADLPTDEHNGHLEYPVAAETEDSWEPLAPRFPTARHGYHRAAVDERVSELERELADLRARTPNAVEAEIERIGEQTAAILRVAHEQAEETLRLAQAQADSCVANAASNAIAITEGAKRELRQLDGETDCIWRERARLIEDVRAVAGALSSVAEDAAGRFEAEPERVESPHPVAVEPRDQKPEGDDLSAPPSV